MPRPWCATSLLHETTHPARSADTRWRESVKRFRLGSPRQRVCHFAIGIQHSGLEPLPNQPQQRPVANPPAQHLDEYVLIEIVEKPLDIGFDHEMVIPELELDRQFVDCVQSPLVRPVSRATTQEILLVDGFQYPCDRQLQQLVLHHRYPQRTLSSVGFRYPVAADQSCPVGLPLQPVD